MGGTRQSRFRRREEEARERQRQRIIIYTAGIVLAVAAVVVVIGVIITVILPPRATVIEVGDRSFTARDVADRSVASLFLGAEPGSLAELVDRTMDAMVREELLRQAGEPIVGEPSQEDIEDQVRSALFEGQEFEGAEFDALYQQVLDESGVSRQDFEHIRRGEVTAERLRAQFDDEIPEAGLQLHLYAVESRDREALEELRDRVAAGEDFVEVAAEVGIEGEAEDWDAGWIAVEALPDDLQEVLPDLEAGETTDPMEISGTIDYEFYYVAARDEEREYDEAAREQLQQVRLTDFLEEQRVALGVEVSLSDGNRNWINNQIQDAISG